MKDYIREQLKKIKSDAPGDDRFSAMHSIYNYLELNGYSCRQARLLIDEVICENIVALSKKLDRRLTKIKTGLREIELQK